MELQAASCNKIAQQFVENRRVAKEIWGNKSLEQNFLKIEVNSLYGKTAQNIKTKSSWNATSAIMEDKGETKIITLPDVQNCEWMNFDSVSYEIVDEYMKFRKVHNSVTCLRIKNDWSKFWLKIHALLPGNTRRRHVRNVKRTMGYSGSP